jgi:hypothetical protein
MEPTFTFYKSGNDVRLVTVVLGGLPAADIRYYRIVGGKGYAHIFDEAWIAEVRSVCRAAVDAELAANQQPTAWELRTQEEAEALTGKPSPIASPVHGIHEANRISQYVDFFRAHRQGKAVPEPFPGAYGLADSLLQKWVKDRPAYSSFLAADDMMAFLAPYCP